MKCTFYTYDIYCRSILLIIMNLNYNAHTKTRYSTQNMYSHFTRKTQKLRIYETRIPYTYQTLCILLPASINGKYFLHPHPTHAHSPPGQILGYFVLIVSVPFESGLFTLLLVFFSNSHAIFRCIEPLSTLLQTQG